MSAKIENIKKTKKSKRFDSHSSFVSAIKPFFNFKNISIIVCIFSIICVAYYILIPSRNYFHSDSTDTIMWAEASYDSGSLFNPDFDYACLLPFGGQLLMLPFVALFGVSMKAHVLGMLVFFILFVLSLNMMLKAMSWEVQWRALSISIIILMLSVSTKMREIFWGHIIYYSLGVFLLFVGISLVYKAINVSKAKEFNSRAFGKYLVLIFIWFFLSATNQVEALTIFIMPAFAGVVGERFLNFKNNSDSEKRRRDILVILIMILGTCSGYILGDILKEGHFASYQNAYSSFSAPESWISNAENFLAHWLTLLGADVEDGQMIIGKTGLVNLLQIFVGIILVVAPVIITTLYPKMKNRNERSMILIHWGVTGLIMMGYIFGKLADANWRLTPIVCTSLILTMMLVKYICQRTSAARVLMILLLPIALVCSVTVLNINDMRSQDYTSNEFYTLSSFLQENDLNYGYGTFWNANVVTVVSDSKVKVRSIDLVSSGYQKSTYQSQMKWFEGEEGRDEYFVILTNDEYNNVCRQDNSLLNGVSRRLKCGDYRILIFDHNIF